MNTSKTKKIDELLFAMQQRNLVYNFNFLNYSNKVGKTPVVFGHPDGWVYNDNGNGGRVGFNSELEACQIVKSQGNDLMTFSQSINEFPRWENYLMGKEVTAVASIEVTGTSSSSIIFSIYDGKSKVSQEEFFNSGDKKELTISLEVNENATTLMLSIESESSAAVLNISKVYANIGTIAIENLPCIVEGVIGERKQYVSTEISPANEFSLCNKSIELSESYSRLDSFLNGKFGRGANRRSLLPDMRGCFNRAWDNESGLDPDSRNREALGEGIVTGDHVGTFQEDEFKQHKHSLNFSISGTAPSMSAPPVTIINPSGSSSTELDGGAETRGKNISELLTMKWS